MFYNPEQTAEFERLLTQVVGQPLAAAGYTSAQTMLQQQRGLLRYVKPIPALGEEVHCFIEWQLLAFAQSPVARFQINLLRNTGNDPRAITTYQARAEASLSWVLWHVFDVHLMPSDASWWDFRNSHELGHALANAGKVLFAYGVPWLEMREKNLS